MGIPKGKVLINVNDIIGKRLGKLEVVSYAGHGYDYVNSKISNGRRMRHYYICECKCGTRKMVQRGQLLNDIVHSCGCSRRKR